MTPSGAAPPENRYWSFDPRSFSNQCQTRIKFNAKNLCEYSQKIWSRSSLIRGNGGARVLNFSRLIYRHFFAVSVMQLFDQINLDALVFVSLCPFFSLTCDTSLHSSPWRRFLWKLISWSPGQISKCFCRSLHPGRQGASAPQPESGPKNSLSVRNVHIFPIWDR